MPQYVIEREIPGAAKLSSVLDQLGPSIKWIQSYVAGDKIYCIYEAPSEELIKTHAQISGFPANRITPIAAIISPATANG